MPRKGILTVLMLLPLAAILALFVFQSGAGPPGGLEGGALQKTLSEILAASDSKSPAGPPGDTEAEAIQKFRDELAAIPDLDYGGIYMGEKHVMHVNLVEGREHLVPKRDSPYIVYHTVKHSLAELYELKDRVSRHGGELGFRLVYADRVANKVHIGYLFSDKGYEEKAAEFVGNPDMYYIGLHHGPFVSR